MANDADDVRMRADRFQHFDFVEEVAHIVHSLRRIAGGSRVQTFDGNGLAVRLHGGPVHNAEGTVTDDAHVVHPLGVDFEVGRCGRDGGVDFALQALDQLTDWIIGSRFVLCDFVELRALNEQFQLYMGLYIIFRLYLSIYLTWNLLLGR